MVAPLVSWLARSFACAALSCIAALSAGAAGVDAERILPGRWISDKDGLVVVVDKSGRFEVMPPDRPSLEGRWWVDDGIVHFRNADDSPVCRGVTGRYRLRTTPGSITFTTVDDECPTREAHLESVLRPHEP
jgi:hypothetical protein